MTWVAFSVALFPSLGFLAMAVGARRPALFLVAVTFLAAHALPLLSVALAPDEQASSALHAYLADVQWLVILATIAFAIGYGSLARWKIPLERPPLCRREFGSTSEWSNLLILLLITALISAQPGGPVGFVLSGFERVPVDDLRFSVTYALACLLNITTILLAIRRMRQRRSPPIISMVVLVMLFWVLGGRAQLFVTLSSLMLCYLAHRRLQWRWLMVLAGAFIALATLTLHFRLSLQGSAQTLQDTFAAGLGQISLLEGYAIAARYFDSVGPYPHLYLDTLQQIIPRAVYPDKPVQISRLLRLMVSRDQLGGLTAGVYGEFLIVGGYLAVTIFGTAFAAGLAMLDNAWTRLRHHTPLNQAAVLILLPLLSVFTLRGGFDTSVFRLEITLLALVFAAAACRVLKRDRAMLLPPALPVVR